MFYELSYYVFSIFIVFIYKSTYVSAVTCSYYQIQCSDIYKNSWCCSNYGYCGDSFGSCVSYTTTSSPPSDLSPGVAVVIIFVSLFFCIMCISCCVRSQQQQQRIRSSFTNTNARMTPHSYQQQPGRRPPRVVQILPIHNVHAAPSVHIMHEEPPPSYEDVIRNLPPSHPSVPPVATVDQANLRV